MLSAILGAAAGILIVVGVLSAITLSKMLASTRKKRKLREEVAALPVNERIYVDPEDPNFWYDLDTGVRKNREQVSFSMFSDYVDLLGGKLEEDIIDITPEEDPFALDGGFLNSEDLEDRKNNDDH